MGFRHGAYRNNTPGFPRHIVGLIGCSSNANTAQGVDVVVGYMVVLLIEMLLIEVLLILSVLGHRMFLCVYGFLRVRHDWYSCRT